MSEERKSRFRIKWADREVEYYGDEAKAAYDDLIAHVKSIPMQATTVTSPNTPSNTPPPSQPAQAPATENRELTLVSRDSGIPIEQLGQLLQFRQSEGFTGLVPFLPRRLEDEDAALVISYALQVGLQMQQLEVNYVKRVLSEVNGHQMPGNRFGVILKGFRRRNWTITSQTGERNRPYALSADGGLEAARGILRNP